MGLSKEDQRNKHRQAGNTSFIQSDKYQLKITTENNFIKKPHKLLPRTKQDQRISFYDSVRFGKYQGKTGAQILLIDKRYLKYAQSAGKIIFCPIMLDKLKN